MNPLYALNDYFNNYTQKNISKFNNKNVDVKNQKESNSAFKFHIPKDLSATNAKGISFKSRILYATRDLKTMFNKKFKKGYMPLSDVDSTLQNILLSFGFKNPHKIPFLKKLNLSKSILSEAYKQKLITKDDYLNYIFQIQGWTTDFVKRQIRIKKNFGINLDSPIDKKDMQLIQNYENKIKQNKTKATEASKQPILTGNDLAKTQTQQKNNELNNLSGKLSSTLDKQSSNITNATKQMANMVAQSNNHMTKIITTNNTTQVNNSNQTAQNNKNENNYDPNIENILLCNLA